MRYRILAGHPKMRRGIPTLPGTFCLFFFVPFGVVDRDLFFFVPFGVVDRDLVDVLAVAPDVLGGVSCILTHLLPNLHFPFFQCSQGFPDECGFSFGLFPLSFGDCDLLSFGFGEGVLRAGLAESPDLLGDAEWCGDRRPCHSWLRGHSRAVL